jgi:hypothetical protein
MAETCSAAPAGRQRWTVRLLADRVVALGLTEAYAYESVRRVVKKTRIIINGHKMYQNQRFKNVPGSVLDALQTGRF